MNIDLLVTPDGQTGLLSSTNLVKKAVGVLLDTQTGVLTLEYADMDHTELNIPIEEEFFGILDMCSHIHIGAVKDGKIAQAYQVPLMFLDDPYRAEAFQHVQDIQKPLAAFHHFVKKCVLGQPAHRDDAGDEETLGCILGDTAPSSLDFAPHLARRHTMEVAPSAAPQINAPGMGLGGSSGAVSSYRQGGYYNKKRSDGNDDSGTSGT